MKSPIEHREFSDDLVQLVERLILQSGTRPPLGWGLEPGDTVRRRALHEAYGGQQQGGISTPKRIPDVLIFTDPAAGRRYGYDEFEGLSEDGIYAYTGEGQTGDQRLVRGNLAIREAAARGKTIRLLRTNGIFATYVGVFELWDPPLRMETIPDVEGEPRRGIIFNLTPITARVDLLPAFGGELPPADQFSDDMARISLWTPPEYFDLTIEGDGEPLPNRRVVSRTEFELQASFGEWLISRDTAPCRLQLRAGNTMIEPDFYVPALNWIVEAKRSTARAFVRTAIGQVLDYTYVAKRAGVRADPVILLPGRPENELLGLAASLSIRVVAPTRSGFEEL